MSNIDTRISEYNKKNFTLILHKSLTIHVTVMALGWQL